MLMLLLGCSQERQAPCNVRCPQRTRLGESMRQALSAEDSPESLRGYNNNLLD
jgi:hypothetical protein